MNDTSVGMRREQKTMRRLRRQEMVAEGQAEWEAAMEGAPDMEDGAVDGQENDAVFGGDEEVSVLGVDVDDEDDVLGVDEDEESGEIYHMDEDSSDDSEDADSSDDSDAADSDAIINDADSSGDSDDESAASDEEEYAWGDHVSSRNAFAYNADDSSDSDGDDSEEEAVGSETQRRSAVMRARRSILQFLRSDRSQI